MSYPEKFDGDQLDRAEYQALETALLQTARGRAFLSEYLRRNGESGGEIQTLTNVESAAQAGAGSPAGTDTDRILQAVEELHKAIMERHNNPPENTRMDILEMARAIARTRAEIAAMRTDGDYDHLTVASEEMDAIVVSTEKATNDILQAAEKIQEVAWRLRESGTDEAMCEEIDNNATDIYMACSFQDLTGQRTTKVIRVLQYLEARINSMVEIWGLADDEELKCCAKKAPADGAPAVLSQDERPDAHLLNGPQATDVALGQDNIDELMGNEDFAQVGNDDAPGAAADSKAAGTEADEQTNEALAGNAGDDPVDEEQLKALFS